MFAMGFFDTGVLVFSVTVGTLVALAMTAGQLFLRATKGKPEVRDAARGKALEVVGWALSSLFKK